MPHPSILSSHPKDESSAVLDECSSVDGSDAVPYFCLIEYEVQRLSCIVDRPKYGTSLLVGLNPAEGFAAGDNQQICRAGIGTRCCSSFLSHIHWFSEPLIIKRQLVTTLGLPRDPSLYGCPILSAARSLFCFETLDCVCKIDRITSHTRS